MSTTPLSYGTVFIKVNRPFHLKAPICTGLRHGLGSKSDLSYDQIETSNWYCDVNNNVKFFKEY